MDVPLTLRLSAQARRFAIGLALLLTACAGTEPAHVPPSLLPPPDPAMPGGYSRYPDERLQQYVQGIGDRLLRTSGHDNVRLRFTVIDDPGFTAVVNRSANVYVSRGLLALLQSEAELAAVLGHEIAHHLSGHSRKTETEALSSLSRSEQLASRIGGRDSRELTLTFTHAMVKGRVREQELEADRLSIEYLTRAGYDPADAIQVLQMLAQLTGAGEPTASSPLDNEEYIAPIFRSHPEPGQRIAAMEAEVRRKRNALSAGDTGRDNYLRAIDGLIFGGNGRDYLRRDGNTYFPRTGLMLRLHNQWRLLTHTAERITLGSADGRFRLVILPESPLATRSGPYDFIQVLARQDVTRKPQSVRLGTYQGQRHDGTLLAPRARIRIDALYLDNRQSLFRLYVLSELSTPAAELRKQTDAVVASLREMTAAERANLQPLRIRIRVAGKNVTYRQLAQRSPLPGTPDLTLRLLNRQLLHGEPKTGEAIKVIH